MFFIKPSVVYLDCFTYLPYVYDYARIELATKYFPEWLIKTPKYNQDNVPTIKNCAGVKDYYKKGIVIPSWFEMELNLSKQTSVEGFDYVWSASNKDIDTNFSHSGDEFYGFCLDDGMNIKLTSPWLFKTNKNIDFTWTQPVWNTRNMIEKLTVLPAVINFYYQHITHINFFTTSPKDIATLAIHIPAKTPLVMLHPMTEKNVVIKNYLTDKKEYDRILGVEKLFLSNTKEQIASIYNRKKKLIDNCPYYTK
jgi:hypothetical protein